MLCGTKRKKLNIEEGKTMDTRWILCPICGNKTRDRIRDDTVLKNYPLYCPKCKQESLIDVKKLHITVIKKAYTQAINLEAEKIFK